MAEPDIKPEVNNPKLIDNHKVGPAMGDDLTTIGRRNKKKPI